jgi:hypothetical protein
MSELRRLAVFRFIPLLRAAVAALLLSVLVAPAGGSALAAPRLPMARWR